MSSISCLSARKIVLFVLVIQTVCLMSNAGRIEISVGGIWPWKRFYTSNGTKCTNIGISLFDLPGINAATVESVLDGKSNCYSCTVYSKSNCAGSSVNLGCGSAKKLPSSVKRPTSFKCVSKCSKCRK